MLGGIGRSAVYDLIERRELTKVNIGRRSFITSDSLDAYMDRLAMADESRKTGSRPGSGLSESHPAITTTEGTSR
jgi:hypothetical protein